MCLAPGHTEQLLSVTVPGVRAQTDCTALGVPLPRPCCCLGTAELRATIPMDWISHLGSGSTFTPFPLSSDPSPSLAALELCPLVAAVSLAWAGSVRLGALGQRSCWGLVPVRARSCSLLCIPAGLRVWGQLCPLHVLLSCPSLWAGAWAGLCSRTEMSCSSPTLGA